MRGKYHISKDGVPRKCVAIRQPCRLGGHFNTEEEAYNYSQEKFRMEDDYETHVLYETEYDMAEAEKRGKFVEQEMEYVKNYKNTSVTEIDEMGNWTKARQEVHKKILGELMDKYKNVPCDKKSIFSAGLPGAGKTTVLTKYENLNMNEWATVSSDDIKEMLAEKGYVPEVEGLTPMESSTLVHEESSYLADRLLSELSKQGKNIIYDFTCKKKSSALRRMGVLTDNGYKYEDMQFVYVDIDPNTAKLRAKNRYLQGLNQGINTAIENKYLDEHEQKKIIGGRYLPEHIIDSCKPKGNKYSSVNAENIVELHSDKSMNLPRPKIYNNMGSEPVAIDYEEFIK